MTYTLSNDWNNSNIVPRSPQENGANAPKTEQTAKNSLPAYKDWPDCGIADAPKYPAKTL